MPFPSLCVQLVVRHLPGAGSFAHSMEVVEMQHYRPLKAPKHTQIITNTLHLRVVTCTTDTLLLWEQVPKNYFSGRSDTVPRLVKVTTKDTKTATAQLLSVKLFQTHISGNNNHYMSHALCVCGRRLWQ